jgi:hypothetical protein
MTPAESFFAQARQLAIDAGRKIATDFGHLDRRERTALLRDFRTQIIPRRKAGRTPSSKVTAAHADWSAGLKGIDLYRKHILGFDQMNRYRRKAMIRALQDAIRNRERRNTGGSVPQG